MQLEKYMYTTQLLIHMKIYRFSLKVKDKYCCQKPRKLVETSFHRNSNLDLYQYLQLTMMLTVFVL